jgi:hypothetical protein
MLHSEEVIRHIFLLISTRFHLLRLDLGGWDIRENGMFQDFLFLESGLEELTIEFLSASGAVLSISIDF